MQRVIPPVIALLVGIVIGVFLIAPYLQPVDPGLEPGALESAPSAGPAAAPAPLPGVTAAAAAGGVRTPAPAVALPSPAAEAGAEAQTGVEQVTAAAGVIQSRPQLLSGAALGTLRIQVVNGEGKRAVRGEVYVMPAGGRTGDSDAGYYQKYLDEDTEEVRVQIPVGHRVDVGYVGPTGQALATEVVASAEGPRLVELRVPQGARMTFEIPELPPMPEGVTRTLVYVRVSPIAPEGSVSSPGRGQVADGWDEVFKRDTAGKFESTPFPPGEYRLSVSVGYWSKTRRVPLFRLVPSRTTLRPGDHATFTIAQLGGISVLVRGTGKDAKGTGVNVIAVNEASNTARAVGHHYFRKLLKAGETGIRSAVALAPGRYHLEWGGRYALKGRSGSFEIVAGEEVRREIAVQFQKTGARGDPAGKYREAPAHRPAVSSLFGREEGDEEEVTISVVMPPGHGPDDDPEYPTLDLFLAKKPGDYVHSDDGWTESIEVDELEFSVGAASYAKLAPIVAVRGMQVSRPMAPAGHLEPKLEPGGLLLLVPELTRYHDRDDFEVPQLTIEREDGAVIPWSDSPEMLKNMSMREYHTTDGLARVELKLGVVLGPLEAGRHRFNIRRGAFLLGTVEVEVVAGTLRALPIR